MTNGQLHRNNWTGHQNGNGNYSTTTDHHHILTIQNGGGATMVLNNACSVYVTFTYDVVLSIVCAIFLVVGLIYSFFGYRLYKIVLFLTGFVFGSVLIYLLCEKEQLLSTPGNAGVALGTGVLVGLITALVQYVGLFMTGFLTGLLWGLVAMVTWSAATPPDTYWAPIGLLFSAGVLFALLTLKFQRILIIMGTSFLGGALIAVSLDYFIEQFALLYLLWDVLNLKPLQWRHLCWFAWAIVLIWPLIFLIGVLVQLKLTGVGFTHKTGWPHHFRTIRRRSHSRQNSRRQRNNGGGSRSEAAEVRCRITTHESTSNNAAAGHYRGAEANNCPPFSSSSGYCTRSLKEKSPPDSQPRSFRHLYQARRKHGDIICQSYMESLQKLAQQQLSAAKRITSATPGTTNSDRTQLTVISTGSNRSNSNSGGSV